MKYVCSFRIACFVERSFKKVHARYLTLKVLERIVKCSSHFTKHDKIESQNHRIAGVGGDLKRSLSPNPLLKQVLYNMLHR